MVFYLISENHAYLANSWASGLTSSNESKEPSEISLALSGELALRGPDL